MITLGIFVGSVKLKGEELSRDELEEAHQACQALLLALGHRMQQVSAMAAFHARSEGAGFLMPWQQTLLEDPVTMRRLSRLLGRKHGKSILVAELLASEEETMGYGGERTEQSPMPSLVMDTEGPPSQATGSLDDAIRCCPFCGHASIRATVERDEQAILQCRRCHACGPAHALVRDAVMHWNQRAPL